MFIRKKRIGGKEYAYLIENKYNKRKKQSRQRSTIYLGKVINLGSADRQTVASTVKEAIINELIRFGFTQEDDKLIREKVIVDLKSIEVKESNRNICLEMNEGFLCNQTLTNLINFNSKDLNQKEIIHSFANSFVSVGINLHHESFITIFTNIFKNS